MQQQLVDEARGVSETLAKAPEKFKVASNWKVFSEAMETYLGQLLGSGRVPLQYVIRTDAIADPQAMYVTPQTHLVAIAPLVGDSFNRDNAKVYGLIKQLILEGPGQTYIMRCNTDTSGRGAWNALRAHFEGDGFRNRNVEHAYSTLEILVYEGEKKGFTFENKPSAIWNVIWNSQGSTNPF